MLRLVGRGQSNPAIASALFIAETTVKTHVAHILTKLYLTDRVQAVVLAYETGLVRVDARLGLTDADYVVLDEWLRGTYGRLAIS